MAFPLKFLEPILYPVTGDDGLFNCYHSDEKTLVSCKIVGNYGYCSGNGEVCDEKFAGGFEGKNYDPRFRLWHISMKEKQMPNWSVPYIFFGSKEMGITSLSNL